MKADKRKRNRLWFSLQESLEGFHNNPEMIVTKFNVTQYTKHRVRRETNHTRWTPVNAPKPTRIFWLWWHYCIEEELIDAWNDSLQGGFDRLGHDHIMTNRLCIRRVVRTIIQLTQLTEYGPVSRVQSRWLGCWCTRSMQTHEDQIKTIYSHSQKILCLQYENMTCTDCKLFTLKGSSFWLIEDFPWRRGFFCAFHRGSISRSFCINRCTRDNSRQCTR